MNATNLHVGGGVQVATSVLHELSRALPKNIELSAAVSTEVDQNLKDLEADLSKLKRYRKIDVYGFRPFCQPLEELISKTDIAFTVFGPLYLYKKPPISLVGFAQPWIIYPKNEIYHALSSRKKILTKFKYALQKIFYIRNSDQLIVEAEHVKSALVEQLKMAPGKVSVIENCTNSIFIDAAPLDVEFLSRGVRELNIGFVGRNYAHKNLAILPKVVRLLVEKHDIRARFHVTLNDREWRECSEEFKSAVVNVGSLSIADCPAFYKRMDAIIFPSLMECFSATPLEAHLMNKPLLASDRPFVKEISGDHPFYFDPLSPDSIASAVKKLFDEPREPLVTRLQSARSHALKNYSPSRRISEYIKLWERVGNT